MKKGNTWTINALINTQAFIDENIKGTWENPVDIIDDWKKYVLFSAVSNDSSNKIYSGFEDMIELPLAPEDKIRFVVSQVTPCYVTRHGIALYGYHKGGSVINGEVKSERTAVVSVTTGFNAKKEPEEEWLSLKNAHVTVPNTKVGEYIDSFVMKIYLKMVLIDISNVRKPVPLNYFIIDPMIIMKSYYDIK